MFWLCWAGPASNGAGKPFRFVAAWGLERSRVGEERSCETTGAGESFGSGWSKGWASLASRWAPEAPAHGQRCWRAARLRSTICRVRTLSRHTWR